MTRRDAVLVLASVLIALGVAAILLVGSLSAGAGQGSAGSPRVSFEGRGGARAQPSGGVAPDPGQRSNPAFAPILPIERGVANAARDAAGYLLLLLAVAGTTVFAREPVVAAYRATIGGWRVQLRTLGTGLAVLALFVSAIFLTSVVFLGALTRGFPGRPGAGLPLPPGLAVQFGLQSGFVILAVLFVLVLVPALVGFAAASWRLGDAIIGLRLFSSWGGLVPPALVALLGTTLIYLLAQAPYVGIVISAAALVYALGAFVISRLQPRGTSLTPQQ